MRRLTAIVATVMGVVAAPAALAQVEGRSTLEQRIARGEGAGFQPLELTGGEPWVVREEGVGVARAGRNERRRSLLYFGQLTDFQLADEESPARVEFVDRGAGSFTAAWRPMEALNPQTIDATVRQMNAFADRSPVAQAGGARARMAFVLLTGDNVDNHQLNETRWQVGLIEGGTIAPNSGVEDEPVYTGVQDRSDTPVPDPYYYDPDGPAGAWATFPRYPGLLDRAQQPFQTPGLKVPSFVAFGNHDMSAQGTQWTTGAFEDLALGGVKVFGEGLVGPVPPDPLRRFVDKAQYKVAHRTAESPDAHGFGFVDAQEERASRGAAGYYQWSPRPGLRFISVDTVCEGTNVARPGPSEGNVDHSQYLWLERQLAGATARDELVVLFSHHAIPSLACDVPDEETGPCDAQDEHGHGVDPGCDLDPRPSTPLHLETDMRDLVLRYPHVIAWVAGHTHNNRIDRYLQPGGGGGFWSIRVASEIDWPQQSRLLELMDNRDGTLSIFGTILDHSAPVDIPASGTAADGFTPAQMASISRALAASDPQVGATAAGEAKDRNVELLVDDPRRARKGAAARCGRATGRVAGRRVGAVRLGATRSATRRSFPTRRTRRGVDLFCLRGGGNVRVTYRRGRVAVALTSSRGYRAAGVRPGSRASRLRGRALRLDARWFVARRTRAPLVFRVARGRVTHLGVAEARLTRTRRSALRLLRAAYR